MTDDSKPKKKEPRLVWIDMEMSGLDPKNNTILEIATIITDRKLNILEEGPDLVIHQPDKVLDQMDDWNKKHHLKSGLIQAVKESKMSLRKAEKLTLEFIKKHCPEPKKALLCGNSVHHDRRFMEKYMPAVHAYLHYRHIDVSTVKSLVIFWFAGSKKAYQKPNLHRALGDIRESIIELRHYRRKYFKAYVRHPQPAAPGPAGHGPFPTSH